MSYGTIFIGWLVALRINVNLAIFQPYLVLEAGDKQSLKIQLARLGIEPRSSCSASQELNHSVTAAPCTIFKNAWCSFCLLCVLRASKFSGLKLIEIVILRVYYTIPFGSSFFRYFWHYFSTFWTTFFGKGSLTSGSIPEMRIWSILVIKSDLKWCIHLNRSLYLYYIEIINYTMHIHMSYKCLTCEWKKAFIFNLIVDRFHTWK